jgi:hypothetical protein
MTGRCARGAILAAVLSSWSPAIAAQSVSVPALKAAFLLNFVKFAEWPPDAIPSGRLFTFCVAGDKDVAAALQATISKHPGPTPVTLMVVAADGALSSCQLLYLGGVELRQSRRAIEALNGAAVFTVSDVEGFAEMGGIAQFRLEKGQMRFVINPSAAQRVHVSLSASLLNLATLVKDGKDEGR